MGQDECFAAVRKRLSACSSPILRALLWPMICILFFLLDLVLLLLFCVAVSVVLLCYAAELVMAAGAIAGIFGGAAICIIHGGVQGVFFLGCGASLLGCAVFGMWIASQMTALLGSFVKQGIPAMRAFAVRKCLYGHLPKREEESV